MDSGLLAAAAGVAGKFAFSEFHIPREIDRIAIEYAVKKVVLITAMLTLNSLMISRYVRALEKSDSALRVQVVNFATNFLCSVLFSLVFFNEGWSEIAKPAWWMGASLMVVGVFVILGGKSKIAWKFCVRNLCNMRFAIDKELWQDCEVRLNLTTEPELATGEKILAAFAVDTSDTWEHGNIYATNLRLFFRASQKTNTVGWGMVTSIFVASETLVVEVAESTDWKFRVPGKLEVEKLKNIRKLAEESAPYRQVMFRSPIIRDKHLSLLASEKVVSEIAGVWNVSGDAGNLGKLVVTNFRLVWFALLQENSNVSIPHVAIKTAETRNSKFGKILVVEISRAKGGSILGFRIDPETTLEKCAVEISRVIETALKQPFYGFTQIEDERKTSEKEEEEEIVPSQSVEMLSRAAALGEDQTEMEYCEELGLMIKKLPKGVTYKSLWEIV